MPNHRPRPSVWLLTNAPSPYQVELFQQIQTRAEVDLQVQFMRSDTNRFDASEDSAASSSRNGGVLKTVLQRDELRLPPKVIHQVMWSEHDCYVLSGMYTSVAFLICAAILSARGKPWASGTPNGTG